MHPLVRPSQQKKIKDLVFIHSNDNVIEKQFGQNESSALTVLKSSIIGFSDSIKLKKAIFQPDKFVSIYGVGIVYLECQSQSMLETQPNDSPDLV